jgi:hypothetical protein
MQRSRASLLLLSLLGASSACFPSSTDPTATTTGTATTTTTTTTAGSVGTLTLTSVTVRPEDFLGPVPCSNNPGAMRSYVVTLKNVTKPFTLASSAPASCAENVEFREVLPCQRYIAEIDGYPLYPWEMKPAGNTSGNRTMIAKSGDSSPLTPSWKVSTKGCAPRDPLAASKACHINVDAGAPTEGVLALEETTAIVPFCEPVTPTDAATLKTSIRVDPRGALGPFSCKAAGGTVASFDIVPEDASLAPQKALACESATATYDTGLKDGVTYTFKVTTVTTTGATFSTICRAEAREARAVVAACEPLH